MEKILENPDFIVLNKPSGVIMYEPNVKNIVRQNEESVADYVRREYPETISVGDKPEERPGMAHRLDRETSGIVVIARTQLFFESLKRQFQERVVLKRYIALVHGAVNDSRTISRPIGLVSGTTRWSTRARRMKMVKPAITELDPIAVTSEEPYYTLISVRPKTGRTHQIRVHLSSIGHAVIGDRLYGPKVTLPFINRQFLHAFEMEFFDLNQKMVRVRAPLPQDLLDVLTKFHLPQP